MCLEYWARRIYVLWVSDCKLSDHSEQKPNNKSHLYSKYRDLAVPKNHVEICDIANDWVKSGDLSQNRFLENYGNLSEASLSF